MDVECRSETCCARLAENAGPKKAPKIGHLGTVTQLCRAISSQRRHVATVRKKFLCSNISSTCLHDMVNFGALAAEIGPVVWGTLQISTGFASWQLAARHSSSGRQPNFAALNRERHLYSAGRPSRWALAHILVIFFTYCYILGINKRRQWCCVCSA